jgi:hypothetical protein
MADGPKHALTEEQKLSDLAVKLNKLTVLELREELNTLGLNKLGKKEDLVERIVAARAENSDGHIMTAKPTADEVGNIMELKNRLILEQEKRNRNLEEINQFLHVKVQELEKENKKLKLIQGNNTKGSMQAGISPPMKQQMSTQSTVRSIVQQMESPIKTQNGERDMSHDKGSRNEDGEGEGEKEAREVRTSYKGALTSERHNSEEEQEKEIGSKAPKRNEIREDMYRRLLAKGKTGAKESVKEVIPKYKPGQIKVIGDSMIRGAAEICKQEGCYVTVYPGIRVDDLALQLQRAQESESEPEVIAIHVGTNNITKRTKVHLITELDDLMESTKAKWSNVKWVVGGIVYRKNVRESTIDKLNDGIRWLCEERGSKFYDPNSKISVNEIASDGLHLNRKGGNILGKLIIEKIDEYQLCNA